LRTRRSGRNANRPNHFGPGGWFNRESGLPTAVGWRPPNRRHRRFGLDVTAHHLAAARRPVHRTTRSEAIRWTHAPHPAAHWPDLIASHLRTATLEARAESHTRSRGAHAGSHPAARTHASTLSHGLPVADAGHPATALPETARTCPGGRAAAREATLFRLPYANLGALRIGQDTYGGCAGGRVVPDDLLTLGPERISARAHGGPLFIGELAHPRSDAVHTGAHLFPNGAVAREQRAFDGIELGELARGQVQLAPHVNQRSHRIASPASRSGPHAPLCLHCDRSGHQGEAKDGRESGDLVH
jgi:hypothetical protein